MKQNNIETAREFYLHKAQMQPDIEELQMMVLYANYLNSDSEVHKSAEEILEECKKAYPYNWGKGWNQALQRYESDLYVPNKVAIKAMHEFAARSMPTVTDEEQWAIATEYAKNDPTIRNAFLDGYKLAITK